MAPQASQLYSRNITTFLATMLKEGVLNIDTSDALVGGTLVTRDGDVLHGPTKAAISAEVAK
jgi:NAD(P) transhydrogenase subunit alpha